jgi:hypothetical protein
VNISMNLVDFLELCELLSYLNNPEGLSFMGLGHAVEKKHSLPFVCAFQYFLSCGNLLYVSSFKHCYFSTPY